MENNNMKVIEKALSFRRNVLELSDDQSIINFEKLVEKAGFFLLISSLPNNYNAKDEKGFAFSGENIEFIFINNSNYYCAQNFTVWHEVYHLIEGHDDFDFNSQQQKKLIEKEADLFAATILVPPNTLKKKIESKIKKNKLFSHDIHKLSIDFNCHYEVVYLQIKHLFPDFYRHDKYFKNLYKSSNNFKFLSNLEIEQIENLRRTGNYYFTHTIIDTLLTNYEKGILSEEKLDNLIIKIKEVVNIDK
ncbi:MULTISPECIES: ImmA/IrrE family metallo-endopeptidase [Staphylococcus]|uniref:ImmA/IrrE family metallo-endopeptidase n=1 Tax=Staphylococcus TaxID=1279 RepID=UPI0009CDB61C|nr:MULTISPECIES: ImmA/IrrE family metallo-endopeptidase [Staphylococcus]OPF66683.1 hypothetical protein ATN85_09290 [Staphylococcus hominis]